MKQAYGKYLLAVMLFGTNGIVASHILLNSYEIVLTRAFIGSLFLIAVFALTKGDFRVWQNRRDFYYIIISGMAMGASWMFLFEAYKYIGVSMGTLVYYCGPVFVVALSPLVFQERLTAVKIAGFFAVLLGLFLLNGASFQQGMFSWGFVCGILAALTYALMVITNKKAASIQGLTNAMYQLCASFIFVAAFTLIKQGPTLSATPDSIWPILILGVVNTGIGCYLYFSSIQHLQAQTVAIFGYLEPLCALFLSAAILHERLSLTQMLGAALILGGAAFGEFFRKRGVKELA